MPMNRSFPTDMRYSDWHRKLDPSLGMIDLDAVECCSRCWEPLALIELTRWGSGEKTVTTMRALARRAGLPAFTVRPDFPDTPVRLSVKDHMRGTSLVLNPDEYERFLLNLRNGHECNRGRSQ